MIDYLKNTELLDYRHPNIQALIADRKWENLNEFDKISQIYVFVKDEIVFGYNEKDRMKASEILSQMMGQCNTKSILLMALLRAVGIPTRIHGFMIDKKLQKGALIGLTYLLAPSKLFHMWVEVYFQGQWVALEGVIPDARLYKAVKGRLQKKDDGYWGYAIAVKSKCDKEMYFSGKDTYSQSLALTDDLGVFDTPDQFLDSYDNISSPIKSYFFAKVFSKKINRRLQKMRNAKPKGS